MIVAIQADTLSVKYIRRDKNSLSEFNIMNELHGNKMVKNPKQTTEQQSSI
jgi:hypothetical protein